MRWLGSTIGGVLWLSYLAVLSGMRIRGPYWRWRAETVFGSDPASPPRAVRLRHLLAYGRWAWRQALRGD